MSNNQQNPHSNGNFNIERMIIVAAPSGAGKSSFVEKICREDKRLVDIVTCTTREMRAGESQGHPYYFLEKEDFQNKVETGFFVEWAVVHNNLYGTPLDQIQNAWSKQLCVIMDIDVQGAKTFRSKYPNSIGIFIVPPSIDELRRRVIKRDGKVPLDLDLRMENAVKELEEAPLFDFRVINDDFEASYQRFKKIVDELLIAR
jgi:guanylate kinase